MEYDQRICAEDCEHDDEQRGYCCRVEGEAGASYVGETHEATGGCGGLTRTMLCTVWAIVVFVIDSDAIVPRQLFALSAFHYQH